MNVFIIGMPQSCRTTVAKEIESINPHKFHYVDAESWIKNSKKGDEFFEFHTKQLKKHPNKYIRNVRKHLSDKINVIDGLNSPHDLVKLFDYNKDIIIFLNRKEYEFDYYDFENIGVSVIRDYCYWLASSNLLNRERWLEFNFNTSSKASENVKMLGSKNTVYLVRSVNKISEIIKEVLVEFS